MKIYNYKNAHVTFEKLQPSGMYLVILRTGNEIKDKIKCDDYSNAIAYCRSFKKIAKNV